MIAVLGAWWDVAVSALVVGYAYAGYPLLLWLVGALRRKPVPPADPDQWPLISVTVPAYNEEASIANTLDRIVASDYPADRRQVLVVSDASSDRTDDIVRLYADRGVELLRMPQRGGKTAAENAAWAHLRGDIVINTDASVRVHPAALRALVRHFADPAVGVVSSRDVSVASADDTSNAGEGGYVGYEMWVRDCETRLGGIVGASGSLYAIRSALHRTLVPAALSRDFASALIARENGFRAVSATDAICYVPRVSALHHEYRRKVRTMTRGLETLWYKRHLMNPFRYGSFALKLISHKLIRWLVPWALVTGLLGVAVLSLTMTGARVVLALAIAAMLAGLAGWFWPDERNIPRLLAVPAYVFSGLLAALHAWIKALSGELNPVWEPTRRAAEARR